MYVQHCYLKLFGSYLSSGYSFLIIAKFSLTNRLGKETVSH